jgi:hypothetical protein
MNYSWIISVLYPNHEFLISPKLFRISNLLVWYCRTQSTSRYMETTKKLKQKTKNIWPSTLVTSLKHEMPEWWTCPLTTVSNFVWVHFRFVWSWSNSHDKAATKEFWHISQKTKDVGVRTCLSKSRFFYNNYSNNFNFNNKSDKIKILKI